MQLKYDSILFVLPEPFLRVRGGYFTKKTSLSFFDGVYDLKYKVAAFVSEDSNSGPVQVAEDDFFELPSYTSTFDFVKKSLTYPNFLKRFVNSCNKIIDSNPTSAIWVRNPSIGGLIFSLCALSRGRKLNSHMCADIVRGWDNPKYSGIQKLLGFIFSKMLFVLQAHIVKNKNVRNFCTGKVLFDFCKKRNVDTHQFVDSTVDYTLGNGLPIDLTSDSKIFLFIGRVQKDKGVDMLLDVFARFNGGRFNQLHIVGSGEMLDSLQSRYMHRPDIVFHGFKDANFISSVLNDTYVTVVPSDNEYEGFPRVIMESWSHGVPCIVADCGGVQAFVKDGVNGLVFPRSSEEDLLNCFNKSLDSNVYDVLRGGANRMTHSSSRAYWVSELKKIGLV